MNHLWDWQYARTSSISIVPGIRVGNWSDSQAATGCTAVVCDHDAVAGADVRGGATASHEINALDPSGIVERIQGVMLAGGSAPGLVSVHGAVEYFKNSARGFATQQGEVPVVPAAALFDRGIGDPDAFPSQSNGLLACMNASTEFERGNVGAGCGAVVGKMCGHTHATKGGLGSAGWETGDGLKVGALAAVNAFGDLLDPETGLTIAGARDEGNSPHCTARSLIEAGASSIGFGSNTTLCVIATNAVLSKAQATAVARIAQTGISRVVSPCHTQFDGDMVFALSMGDHKADLNRIGILAARLIEAAILDAALCAESLHGIPSATDLGWFRTDSNGAGQ
jgi:L-aminopeptidase/D-esterase-like protein